MKHSQMQIEDCFWSPVISKMCNETIPYQYEVLNDEIEGIPSSHAIENFRIASGQKNGKYVGMLFQDSDVAKWIEAAAYSLKVNDDPEIRKKIEAVIDLIEQTQQEDGYLDTYYICEKPDQRLKNIAHGHEMYCAGHLLEAAVGYAEVTGEERFLHIMERYIEWFMDRIGPDENQLHIYPGHPELELALYKLYQYTGNDQYLEFMKYILMERGKQPSFLLEDSGYGEQYHDKWFALEYHQAHKPVLEQTEAVGHAVRAMYLYSGMADIARITKDEELYQACVRLWNNVTKKKMYITGGIGATHLGEAFSFPYDLPNDTAYAETCASIGLMFWARRMLEIVPDVKYADIMERALYNGVLSGMALDGKSFFYVNPLEVLPEACHKDERKFHVKPVRQKWFGCACCPPNLARLISSIGSYAFTENEDTLFVHLYMGSNVEKTVNGKTVNVQMESDMPWEGNIKIRVQAENAKMTLALRIPGWCKNYKISGIEDAAQEEKDGYLYLKKVWNREETFCIDFPMEVQMFAASERVREDIGKAAIMRGPVVYCLEEKDNGKNLHELLVDTDMHESVSEGKICDTVVKMVEIDGWRLTESGDAEETLYHMYQKPQKQKVRLHYIPYYTWANRGENEMQVWTRVQNP